MSLWLIDGLGSLSMFLSDSTISGHVNAINNERNYVIDGLAMLWSVARLPFHVVCLTIADISALSHYMYQNGLTA